MKKTYILFLISAMLLMFADTAFCKGKQSMVSVTVEGPADTDIYIRDFKIAPTHMFDGKGKPTIKIWLKDYPMCTIDNSGSGKLVTSMYVYKKYKKNFIAVKEGYEPQALPFDPKKKSFKFDFTQKSKFTAAEYWDKAIYEKKDDKKLEYYRQAIYQDYRNEQGFKAYAMMEMGLIYWQQEQFSPAEFYLAEAAKLDPYCGAQEYLASMNGIIAEAKVKNQERMAKAKRRDEIVKNVSGVVATATFSAAAMLQQNQAASAGNGDSYSSGSSGSSSKSGSGSKGSSNDIMSKNTDTKTYSRCESELSKMQSGLIQFNASIKQDHQRTMREIRQKWTSRGYNMYQSPLENW